MARKKPTTTDLTAQSVALAEFAARSLVAAEQLGVEKKVVDGLALDEFERAIAADLPGLSTTLKRKLAKNGSGFTVAETASVVMALAESLREGDPLYRFKLLCIAKKLTDCLHSNVVPATSAKATKSKATSTVYQFKITLQGSEPPIWRRIQVANCTLDKLHEHIQTSMGWTNSHLHRFEIGDKRYADPMLMEEDMEEFGYLDSTRIKISQVVPKSGERLGFSYEYDFGDGWKHEVLFEGCPLKAAGTKYPVCLEGDRACPPEDVGGIGGFYEFLDALADPRHEQHDDFLEWSGGFDPEKFDAKQATQAMKQGLPDWRSDEDTW